MRREDIPMGYTRVPARNVMIYRDHTGYWLTCLDGTIPGDTTIDAVMTFQCHARETYSATVTPPSDNGIPAAVSHDKTSSVQRL